MKFINLASILLLSSFPILVLFLVLIDPAALRGSLDFIPIFTLIVNVWAILVGAYLIVVQLRNQHDSAMKVVREGNKNELKTKIYEQLVLQISKSIELLTTLKIDIYSLPRQIHTFREAHKTYGDKAKWIGPDVNTLRLNFFESTTSVSDLMILVERYEVLMPGIKIFNLAFSVANDEAQNLFNRLYPITFEFLPFDLKEGHSLPKTFPPDDQILAFQDITNELEEKLAIQITYITDLANEAQNLLLGPIFNSYVERRKPGEPDKYLVITTDANDVARLKDHFENHTEYGRRTRGFFSDQGVSA